jgi:enoyl-CoA hydratase/carnithine racemase
VDNKKINWEIEDKIAYLTLVSAPKNEMDSMFFEEFNTIISRIERSQNIKGIIIQSMGRHFSSGANVEELFSVLDFSNKTIPPTITNNSEAFKALNNLDLPVVACIKGICYGSGLELALSANFRVASKNSMFSLPETGFGIMPGLGGIYNSRKCMGSARALEFVLSGNSLSSEEALDYGLVDLIKGKDELTDTATKLIYLSSDNYRKELKPIYLKVFSRFT